MTLYPHRISHSPMVPVLLRDTPNKTNMTSYAIDYAYPSTPTMWSLEPVTPSSTTSSNNDHSSMSSMGSLNLVMPLSTTSSTTTAQHNTDRLPRASYTVVDYNYSGTSLEKCAIS